MFKKLLSLAALALCAGSSFAKEDVTSTYLTNADLTSLEGWTIYKADDAIGGDKGYTDWKTDGATPVIEFYHSWSRDAGAAIGNTKSFDFAQTVTLPAGYYRLKVNAFYREGNGGSTSQEKAFIYATTKTDGYDYQKYIGTWSSLSGYTGGSELYQAADAFNKGNFANEFDFDVAADNTEVTVGFHGYIDTYCSWCILGPVTLYKYEISDFTAEFNTKVDEAKALYNTPMNKDVLATLKACAEVNQKAWTKKEQITTAYNKLCDAIKSANESITDYASQKAQCDAYESRIAAAGLQDAMEDFTNGFLEEYNAGNLHGELSELIQEYGEQISALWQNAQDMTDRIIVNPSYEYRSVDGWTNDECGGAADNKYWEGRTGDIFAEKWTGSYNKSNGDGEKLYDGSISQTITLPAGEYYLVVDAKCEQQNGNTAAKGMFVFIGNNTYEVNSATGEECIVYYKNETKGDVAIGVKIKECTGNWACYDNFRLMYIGESTDFVATKAWTTAVTAYNEANAAAKGVDSSKKMGATASTDLTTAKSTYGDKTYTTIADYEAATKALNDAANAAKSSIAYYAVYTPWVELYDSLDEAGKAALTDNIAKSILNDYNSGKLDEVQYPDASSTANTYFVPQVRACVKAQTTDGADFTGAIVNPNFDGNINGWTDGFTSATAVNHQYQGATYTNGDVSVSGFMEAWTWGSNLGDGKLSQVINELPEGNYTLSADLIAVAQGTRIAEGTAQVGVYVFATCTAGTFKSEDCSTADGKPQSFSFTFDTTSGDCELGLMTQSTNCNWIAFDNVKLVRNGASTVNIYQEALKEAVKNATAPENIEDECLYLLLQKYTSAYNTAKSTSEVNGKTDEEYKNAKEDLDKAKVDLEASIKAYAYSKPIRDAVTNGTNVAIYADSAEDMAANWSLDHEDVNFHFNHWSTEGESDGTGMGKNFNEYWTAGGGKLADGVITRTPYVGLTQGNYAVSMLVRVENEAGGEATGVKFNDIEINSTNATQFGKGVYAVVTDVITVGADGVLKFGFTVKDAEANWFVWKGLTIKYLGTATTDATATVKAAAGKYGTFCVPYVVAAPEGAKVYTVTDVDAENNIVMTEVEGAIPANTPVLIENTTESAINVETSGVDYATIRDLDKGLLTGVLEEKTAPAGSYVLQTQNGAQAFFKVKEGEEPTIAANKAYLVVYSDAGSSEIKAFGIGAENGQETAIKAIDALVSGDAKIYDLNGRQLKTLQKGVNIVNGVKVMVK